MKLAETLLETPQLGVAKRSPIAAIEDEKQSAMAGEQVSRRDRFSSRIQEREPRSGLARAQSALGGRDLFARIENGKDEKAGDQDAQCADYGTAHFTAKAFRGAKSLFDADCQQCSAHEKKNVIDPWNVASTGENRKDRNVADCGGYDDQEPRPNEKVETAFDQSLLQAKSISHTVSRVLVTRAKCQGAKLEFALARFRRWI